MFKRRPLKKDGTPEAPPNARPPSQRPSSAHSRPSGQNQSVRPAGDAQATGTPAVRRNRNRNRSRNRGPAKSPEGTVNLNPAQGQRHRQKGRDRRPSQPQFPAHIQRDLLLVAAPSGEIKGIEEVRIKFDPLAKKIPAHVTLLFPENESVIKREFLKTFERTSDWSRW